MQRKQGFDASIKLRINKRIKERLQEISQASDGTLTVSDLVRMFIEDGLYERGLLPEDYKHSRGL